MQLLCAITMCKNETKETKDNDFYAPFFDVHICNVVFEKSLWDGCNQ